jgi:hypothetical protein
MCYTHTPHNAHLSLSGAPPPLAKLTGTGTDARHVLDESECHRLARDSVRRRFELEKAERSHFAARSEFMGYIESILESVTIFKNK